MKITLPTLVFLFFFHNIYSQSLTVTAPNCLLNNAVFEKDGIIDGRNSYTHTGNVTAYIFWSNAVSMWILGIQGGGPAYENATDLLLPPCSAVYPWTDLSGCGSLILTGDCEGGTNYTSQGTGNWEDASTWSPSVPPNPLNAGDEVVIGLLHTVSLNSSQDIQGKIDLKNPAGRIKVKSGGNLNITSGELTTNAVATAVIVESGGNLTIGNSGTFNCTESGSTLSIESGGAFNSTGVFNLSGNLNYKNAPAFLPSGTFNWNNGGDIRIRETGSMTLSSPLLIPSGANLEVIGELINNSTIQLNGTLDLNDQTAFNFNNTSGTINLYAAGKLTLTNFETIALPNGTLNWNTGGISNSLKLV